jgi:ribosomal protein L37AE/L43A
MAFDDIPEDGCQSFPCPHCEEGNITENDLGIWECDTCPFYADPMETPKP